MNDKIIYRTWLIVWKKEENLMPWTPDLSVGVAMIDEQHKMLFEKVDKLFEAGKNNQEKEYISKLLDFLDAYTKKHFSDEEKYMLSIHYPGYAAQRLTTIS